MFRWLTITILLAVSTISADRWLMREKERILKTALAVGGGSVSALLLWALGNLAGPGTFPGSADLAFLGLPLGQAVGLVCDGVWHQRQYILPELVFDICVDLAVFPLCICGGSVFRYAVYLAVLLLCLCTLPERADHGRVSPCEFWPQYRGMYLRASLLPCLFLVPELLLLLICGRPGIGEALSLCISFLLLSGFGLWLGQEFMRRVLAEELNEAFGRWQQESRDYMNTIRSQRHDFNLHLHAISGLVESGRYEECQAYVSRLVLEANAVNDIMPVNDAVVGSMLYHMREEARSRGSDITYEITYDMRDIFCNGFECNKIIGNLLQNAIDALRTPEDKAQGIRLCILKRRGNTVIILENRFTGEPDRIARVFDPGYSTKKGHEGIGLSMVLKTVERYRGRIYPEFDGELIRFVVNIPNRVSLVEGREEG